MTLRSKLLLLLVALFSGLGATQWFLFHSLTRELHQEAGEAAFEVGNSVASALGHAVPAESADESIPASVLTPAVTLREREDSLILLATETEDGDVAVEMRLGPSENQSVAWTDIAPATPVPGEEGSGGVVEYQIPIPRQGFDEAFERYSSSLTFGFLLLSGLGLIAAGWITLRVSAPLRSLSEAARHLGDGELGLQAEVTGSAEIVATARAFNHMSCELEKYAQLARELQEREHLSEIGELAQALAHSLRNPLNALGLTLEEHERDLATRGESWAEASSARAQIRRIDGSVRSLLSITGVEGTKVEEVRLGQIARDVALEVMQDFGNGLEIEVSETQGPIRLRAVLPELRAVLQTLLVNAAEASRDNGRIEVALATKGEGEWVVEVSDHGQGLEPQIEEQLFRPHATTKSSGTGMGLFLARRIVESHYRGSLKLEQQDGGGVRARLVLRSHVGGSLD